MKTVAVVPMKLNNQRLPGKNTRPFTNGKPLCEYVLSTLLTVDGLDAAYVYCSNPAIQDYLPSGIVYLKRSERLDEDTTKINEVLSAFAHDVYADIYVLAHATAPFIAKASIEKGLRAVKSGKCDSAFSVRKVQDFLWKDGKPFNYDLDKIPRTQDLPTLYMETSGVYIYRRELITRSNRRIGVKPLLVEVNAVESMDIDEEEDFMIADAIYQNLVAQNRMGGGGYNLS